MRSSLADAAGVCFFLVISLSFSFSCNPDEMRNCLTAPPRHPDGSNFLWTTSFMIRDQQQGVERNYRKKKKGSNGKTHGWKRLSWHNGLRLNCANYQINKLKFKFLWTPLKSKGVSKLREFQEISRYIFSSHYCYQHRAEVIIVIDRRTRGSFQSAKLSSVSTEELRAVWHTDVQMHTQTRATGCISL